MVGLAFRFSLVAIDGCRLFRWEKASRSDYVWSAHILVVCVDVFESRTARVFQVRRILRWVRQRRRRMDANGRADANRRDRSADRNLVLHVPDNELFD